MDDRNNGQGETRKTLFMRLGSLHAALVTQPLPKRWMDFFARHLVLTFALMGLFFLAFGFISVNLFVVLKANIELFIEHGAMVIEDGALQQLGELMLSGYLSVVFFLLFKICERIIVDRLTGKSPAGIAPPPR